jgi:diaminopimelate decarboxylase
MNKKVLFEKLPTPCYIFDEDVFASQIDLISKCLPGIPLCYSIKANPFLIKSIPDTVTHVEVCSPGELTICEKSGIDLKTVIFSGVNKTEDDIERAMRDNVGIFTAESEKHLNLINTCAEKYGKRVKLILRLSCGNQFGMDEEELRDFICRRDEYNGVDIFGIHYYTGTQKIKAAFIKKELEKLDSLLTDLNETCNYVPSLVEYGPGLACNYFADNADEIDRQLLEEVAIDLLAFAEKYPLGIEMGRFMASSCGKYYTSVEDVKTIHGINYAICDGGIHHLKYYGQTMSMQVPPLKVFNSVNGDTLDWSLCGSLCTTADVFVRKVSLAGLGLGSVLEFGKCGAYSVTEAPVLFLSRPMPEINLYSEEKGLRKVRKTFCSDTLNQY